MALIDFEMDFGYKPQGDTEYRTRIYGKNRLKRTSGMSMNENELVLRGITAPCDRYYTLQDLTAASTLNA
ncbi:MAG: hypothetical protein PHV59_00795 [Victivallales bacterium]|nr:hypothetical protein [Victivallales bacterium]